MAKITRHGGPTDINDPGLDPRRGVDEQLELDYETLPEPMVLEPEAPAPDVNPMLKAEGEADVEFGQPVPTGSIEDVKNYVDGDWVKAERALAVEQERVPVRTSLVDWLQKVIATKPATP